MPEKNGKYYVSFDVPEFYSERVDLSFDYPRCEKDYKEILGVKIPYPRCQKHRMEIKFDVPRIRWKRVEIETPYDNEDEFDEKLKQAINKLIESKEGFEKGKEDVEKQFDEKIENAQSAGATEEAELISLEKQVVIKRLEMQIAALEQQIKELGENAGAIMKEEVKKIKGAG